MSAVVPMSRSSVCCPEVKQVFRQSQSSRGHMQALRNALLWIGCSLLALPFHSSTLAEEIPATAKAVAEWSEPGAQAWTAENRLWIQLASVKKDEVVKVPRFIGVVKHVTWLRGSDAMLNVQPEPDHWTIRLTALPDGADQAAQQTLVLQFDEPPILFSQRKPVQADQHGVITLRARDGIVHGANLRYEPQPHKNTVGYWSNEQDWAEWHFAVKQPGAYELEILQGCGKGHGGSKVIIETADQKTGFEVQETGHFQNFVWRKLGTVKLAEGADTGLTVRCQQKISGAVMDIRAIRLAPSAAPRSFDPELAAPEALPPAAK